MGKIFVVLPLLAALAPASLGAAGARVPATPVPAATAMRIDGDVVEAAWESAPVITGFLQREPRDGAPATFETEARVLYDNDALYIAVHAIDTDPSKLIGLRTRRDEGSPSDWIRITIDSFRDRRTAYEFAVNPAGVKQDTYWFNDGSTDPGWDAVWDVAVSTSNEGWRAEFRIPFSQLRFHQAENATFGFAIVRQVGRLNETSSWPLLSRNVNGYVSSFGELTGLRLTQSARRLELVPYVVGNVRTEPGGNNPLVPGNDPGASLGVDLKYALKPGLTLTATMNPDFGQVEADPAVVNLSAFETFFSERRPFFVEGSGIFRFDTDCNDGNCSGMFYSRRIGRSPRGSAMFDGPAGYSTQPSQTTILGAAKLTGRIAGFSIGALNAITSAEHATLESGGVRSRQTVEPLTSYSVVRARREFANQSTLGFMTTATNRRLDDMTRFLPSNAYAGGMDWDWRLSPSYSFTGFVAGSSVLGASEAISALQRSTVHSYQRPDADHVEWDPFRESLNGYGGNLAINKIGGERVRFSSNVGVRSPGFDVNDLGFLRRADQRTMSNWFQWRHDRPTKLTRSFRWNLNQWAGWNFDGDRLYSGGNFNAHAVFNNLWSTGFGVNLEGQGFDDRATRGGPGAYRSSGKSIWTYLNTNSRKRLSAYVNTFNLRRREGGGVDEVSPGLTFRPSTFVTVSGGFRLTSNRDVQQWIGNDAGRYLFGRIDQRTSALTARVNYTVTPTLTIQLYAEPFVSAGRYSDFKQLVDGRARDIAGRFVPAAYGGSPDFNYRSFRTTNVLRWEYKPGSTLFLVWQQGREDTDGAGRFDFNRDFGRVFDAPGRNVFLVKWAYWLNY